MREPVLVQGDARALPLPDSSVDLICTSPPYFSLRDYGYDGQLGTEPSPREFIDALIVCTAEMVRVLKPSGSIFVNLGDKYNSAASGYQDGPLGGGRADRMAGRGRTAASVPVKSLHLLPERYRIRAVDELGLTARAVIVWSKTNGLPESVTDRVRRSHEDWVHLTRSPRYYAAVDEIREPHTMQPQRRPRGRPQDRTPRQGQPRQSWSTAQRAEVGVDGHPLGKLPGSVWPVATQPLKVPAELGVDHYAAFPMHWPRQLIRGWCPPGGTVLDPFSGTGTTALVAAMLGRRGIGVDLSADYQRIARWRCGDEKQRARAAGHTPRPARPRAPAQSALFDAGGA